MEKMIQGMMKRYALFIALGYVSLASSSPVVSTVIAPVLLVVAYAVLIPLGIIL